ncbi:uncharacterized protein LTR77_010788 [Saxophila tyrrhenica]|uniref:Uncharacterized protein n=1 Tax=Saxophila tyrrhenica TaxID=1690608 RepID=A0AAV9NU69_9PEZI|nr:hypothetical protein LTR77_010788 [Saxophila tyrrhenica]
MRIGAEAASSTGKGDTNLYYLHQSIPHLHDIRLTGPYFTPLELANDMYHFFGPSCFRARDKLTEAVQAGTLIDIESITTPVHNDQNRVRTCHILREANPTVRARMPGPMYYVASSAILTELAELIPHAPDDPSVILPMKDKQVHGSFLDKDEAFAKAREVAREVAAGMEGSGMIDIPQHMAISPAEMMLVTVAQVPIGSGGMVNVGVYFSDRREGQGE